MGAGGAAGGATAFGSAARCGGAVGGATGCSRCGLLPRCSDLPRASTGLVSDAVGGGRTVGGAAACVGATTLTTGAGAAAAGFNSFRAASSSGLPGFAVNCCCCAAKPGWAAGGAVRATTDRSNTWAGGLLPWPAFPRTLFCVGVMGAAIASGALATMSRETRTAALDTGCDWTNVLVGTAMMAPATSRLA